MKRKRKIVHYAGMFDFVGTACGLMWDRYVRATSGPRCVTCKNCKRVLAARRRRTP